MEYEKRRHPRFNPKGLVANITITPPPPSEKIIFHGRIVDMSYTGIKIKLDSSMTKDLSGSEIKIKFTIPQSGVPVSIQGKIKHIKNNFELGLQYSELYQEHKIDDLMFECIKIADQPVQGVVIPFPESQKN